MEQKKKVVLWINRMKPLPAQYNELGRRLGGFDLVLHDKHLGSVREMMRVVEGCRPDYVVPFLPPSFLARLTEEAKKKGFTVLGTDLEIVHYCDSNPCPLFDPKTDFIAKEADAETGGERMKHVRFKGFTVLREVRIETTRKVVKSSRPRRLVRQEKVTWVEEEWE